jgi:DNA polymerase I-like protein with 3'-5' exonuclease and polymerase domains
MTGKYIYSGNDLCPPFTKKDKIIFEKPREKAKEFIYAFLYGGGDGKIGSLVGGNARVGKELKATFFKSLPALAVLSDKVKAFAARHKFLPSIDNRKIRVRTWEGKVLVHTALNCLLQANGSIVVKRAMIIADEEIKRRGLDAFQIIFYHDELAYDSAEDCAEEVGQIMVESFKKAGEFYNLNIPLTGEYKVGMDWSIH